jgi:ketosteroid isomerase-like protein
MNDADSLAALYRRHRAAIVAWARGNIREYVSMVSHSEDFTLMAPFGGAPSRGFDRSEGNVAAIDAYFSGGDGDVELVESYASGDMVVFATIERQHCLVGGLPDQDWSLRVTVVYRREGHEWRLVHRHADPLARAVGLEVAARIARGELSAVTP